MNINKLKLQSALEIVKPGLASKEIIEQATSFAFMEGRVVTYNDEISISHPVEGLDIQGAVKAELLYQLISKLKSEEIEVNIKDSEIILKSGKAKAGLIVQSEISLPLEAIADKGKWKTLPETFCKHLGFCVSSTGKDMSRQVLTCVHVHKEDGQGGTAWIEASDGRRISKCTFESMPVKTFLIPASSALTVIKMEPTKIAEGKGWIHFKTAEGTVLSCRIFDKDQFPDTDWLFDVKGSHISLPKNIDKVLERASIFSKREHALDEFIDISLSKDEMLIQADADAGWFKEKLKIQYNGAEITFSVAPYLLKGILAETLDCILSKEKMKFTGDDWVYITGLKATKPTA